MASSRYEVALTRAAEKDLDRLRGHYATIHAVLEQLTTHPFAGHALTGQLKGTRSLEFTLPGTGACRAVYIVQHHRVCLVFIVGPHENIYKRALSRYKALLRSGER